MLDTQLIFIVNGEDVAVTISVLAPLSAARLQALLVSHNHGRPPSEWEVRDEFGYLIDSTKSVNRLGLMPNTRLFLTLRAGWGGALAA